MFKVRGFALLVSLFFLGGVLDVQAASLYIDPAFSSISRGDAIELSVRLDTDEEAEECINAVDGVITYSENITPVDVSIGDSIFSIWVEQPIINKENRTITFAGGIPNGYCGRIPGDPRLTNTLVKLIFRSPGFSIGGTTGSSTATIAFAPETTAYINDGFGTKAELAMYGTSIDLSDTAGASLQDPWRDAVVTDTIPPEQFGISIERIPPVTGDYYAVFNTSDKQTGIDHYQVIEEPISGKWSFDWGRADAPWVTTQSPHSPYLLDDQSLNSVIRVKAIDKAGNEYIATVVPEESLRGLSVQNIIVWAGLGLLGLLSLVIIVTVVRAFLKRRKANKEMDITSKNTDHDTTL
jgi:hypothetical protein